jgi:hypothetical protein
MNQIKKTKLIYVLSAAYSGSTLMGLALGEHPSIINLGEVTNLEHDYSESAKCTCKESLRNCSFWTSVKQLVDEKSSQSLSFNLSKMGKREYLDRRGGFKKNYLMFGCGMAAAYRKKYLCRYRKKNENFFSSILSAFPTVEYLVDLSKSSERLEVLLSSNQLDIWCIYLRRDPLKVYASTLKRPKRTRKFLGPKSVREAIWLRARTQNMEKIFSRVPDSRRIEVEFTKFVSDPHGSLSKIFEKLELTSVKKNSAESFTICPSHQHVYVGNRWLFDQELINISIKEHHDIGKLSLFQKMIFQAIWREEQVL